MKTGRLVAGIFVTLFILSMGVSVMAANDDSQGGAPQTGQQSTCPTCPGYTGRIDNTDAKKSDDAGSAKSTDDKGSTSGTGR